MKLELSRDFQFHMTRNIYIREKWTFVKLNYSITRASIRNYYINFSGILIGLNLASNRICADICINTPYIGTKEHTFDRIIVVK